MTPPRPIRPLSRDEVRSIDARAVAELGLPTLLLMENAGRGAADLLASRLAPAEAATILCGPGNNGGDGAVVARHLDGLGIPTRVLWLVPPDTLRGDAATQHAILARSGIPQQISADLSSDLSGATGWLVDALLGTGLTRPVSGPLLAAIRAINASGLPVLSLDLPSGLLADEGTPHPEAVRATVTATFVAPKLGFSVAGASAYTGDVEVVAIGVPRFLLRNV